MRAHTVILGAGATIDVQRLLSRIRHAGTEKRNPENNTNGT